LLHWSYSHYLVDCAFTSLQLGLPSISVAKMVWQALHSIAMNTSTSSTCIVEV
jgi:hypothetical protein